MNRGCVPSKALLAASGRVRELQNEMHLKAMGIQVLHSSPVLIFVPSMLFLVSCGSLILLFIILHGRMPCSASCTACFVQQRCEIEAVIN